MLFFISNTIVLGGNGSISFGRWEKGSGDAKECFDLVTLGGGLTSDFIIRFNIFLACQTHLLQPKLLVGDAHGVQFGECVLFGFEQTVIGAIDTISS